MGGRPTRCPECTLSCCISAIDHRSWQCANCGALFGYDEDGLFVFSADEIGAKKFDADVVEKLLVGVRNAKAAFSE